MGENERYVRIFEPLTRLPACRGVLTTLKQIYQSLCPYEDKEAEEMALSSLTFGITAFVLGFVGMFFANLLFCGISVFTFISSFFTGYYAYNEALMHRQNQLSEKLSQELSSYFLNVSHYYQSEGSILIALSQGAVSLSPEIQTIARFIIDTLSAENAEDLIYTYVTDADKNLYLKLFLQQCYECFEQGHKTKREIPPFCETLETFRVDMLRTKMERQKYNAKLQGLSFVIWMPALAMSFIQKFGVTLTEEMPQFFAQYGLIIELITIATAFFLYRSLNRTKYRHLKTITVHKKYYEIQEYLGCFSNMEENRFTRLLKEVSCNAPPSVCYTKMVVDAITGILVGLTLVVFSAIQNHTLIQTEQLLLSLCCGLVFLAFPLKVVLLRIQFKKDREAEVDSFQLLMLSEMHSKTITLADLLTKMERLANYYKLAIGECLNTFSYDQTKALTELKKTADREGDIPLSNIADMLISVDRLGIAKSFIELKVNRQLGLEERHILAEISADKQKNLLELLSSVPAMLAIGLYVVVPFVYYTFKDLESVMGTLEGMGI